MTNSLKHIILISLGLGLIIFTNSSPLSLNPKNSGTGKSSQVALVSNNQVMLPALLPLSHQNKSTNECEAPPFLSPYYYFKKQVRTVVQKVRNMPPVTDLKPNQPIAAVMDWVKKEEEVRRARGTTDVPLGVQCGGRVLVEEGIGPLTTRPCCTGCCVPCTPLCCGDCGCCVASCERICECISGPGAAYLWDSVTGICGCGIE